ncbi:MAG: hypothetical protein AVDCRST_MAG68-1990, partial [uncultured Gemmatimonadetes bacterium]
WRAAHRTVSVPRGRRRAPARAAASASRTGSRGRSAVERAERVGATNAPLRCFIAAYQPIRPRRADT